MLTRLIKEWLRNYTLSDGRPRVARHLFNLLLWAHHTYIFETPLHQQTYQQSLRCPPTSAAAACPSCVSTKSLRSDGTFTRILCQIQSYFLCRLSDYIDSPARVSPCTSLEGRSYSRRMTHGSDECEFDTVRAYVLPLGGVGTSGDGNNSQIGRPFLSSSYNMKCSPLVCYLYFCTLALRTETHRTNTQENII